MDNMLNDLLMEIKYSDGHFPKSQLEEIIERKDEFIPLLMNILKDIPNNLDKYTEPECFYHIYAAYLLAQFRAREAFPLFIDIMKLPGEMPYTLYGDSLTEDSGRIMASLYDGNFKSIKELINDEKVDEFVKSQALICLVILVLNDVLDRDTIVKYMTDLLNEKLKEHDSGIISFIINALNDLYPEESYNIIEEAYENQEVDEFIISLDDVKRTLKKTKEDVLSTARNNHFKTYIDDTIKELSNWAAFNNRTMNYSNIEDKNREAFLKSKKSKERSKRKAAKQQKKKNRKK